MLPKGLLFCSPKIVNLKNWSLSFLSSPHSLFFCSMVSLSPLTWPLTSTQTACPKPALSHWVSVTDVAHVWTDVGTHFPLSVSYFSISLFPFVFHQHFHPPRQSFHLSISLTKLLRIMSRLRLMFCLSFSLPYTVLSKHLSIKANSWESSAKACALRMMWFDAWH